MPSTWQSLKLVFKLYLLLFFGQRRHCLLLCQRTAEAHDHINHNYQLRFFFHFVPPLHTTYTWNNICIFLSVGTHSCILSFNTTVICGPHFTIYLLCYMGMNKILFSDWSVPHFFVSLLFVLHLISLLLPLPRLIVLLALILLSLFLMRKDNMIIISCVHFTFYFLTTFDHYRFGLNGKLESKMERSTARDECFLPTNARSVLFTWPKLFNEIYRLRLTRSLTTVHQTRWIACTIFSGSILNLNVILQVKNRCHWYIK